MKVTISVKGRFHAFFLANYLSRRGALRRLITTYPGFAAAKYGVPRGAVRSLLVHEIGDRLLAKLRKLCRCRLDTQFLQHELFDRHAALCLPRGTDLFVGWTSSALHSLRRAKQQGCITIVERGSSHILSQVELLRDEYDALGLRAELPDPRIVDKELQEYAEADFISIPSLFVKRSFLRHGVPEGKLIHIPYGVDLTHFHRVEKEDSVFRIIFVGTSSARKGVHYLVQAFSELKLPRAELWLIGSVTDEMRRFVAGREREQIYLKGPFRENELYKYYSQGSVFCLPSIEEGLAMVQLQAMACGLPVICTTHTGGEDVIRDGRDGFVIPIRDVEALKAKIAVLYENPELCRELGVSAEKRVRSGFSWTDYGDRMYRQYERILGNRLGAGGADEPGSGRRI